MIRVNFEVIVNWQNGYEFDFATDMIDEVTEWLIGDLGIPANQFHCHIEDSKAIA